MRTETIVYEGRKTVISNRLVSTDVTEMRYRVAIREAYPELREHDLAALRIELPPVANVDGLTNIEYYGAQGWADYSNRRRFLLNAEYPVGVLLSARLDNVASLMARIVSTEESFVKPDRSLDPVLAYEDALSQEEVELEQADLGGEKKKIKASGGIWVLIVQKIWEMDRPIGPLEEQSKEMVGAVAANPTGAADTSNGRHKPTRS